MRILMLATYFPPDTAISAIRPYMFAKYLSEMGHEVTVIRSGNINHRGDDFYSLSGMPFQVLSYLGPESSSERWLRGELPESAPVKSRISFLPYVIRKPIAATFHRMDRSRAWTARHQRELRNNTLQKQAIDALADRKFDIVWATVGEYENIEAARYASTVFHCPWIVDFRDPMAQASTQSGREYRYIKQVQNRAILEANACVAVSDDLAAQLTGSLGKNIVTIYNGYEPLRTPPPDPAVSRRKLSLCYTGSLYHGRRNCFVLFDTLRKLSDLGEIDLDNVVFHYAGSEYEELLIQARRYGVDRILVDHGYLNQEEAAKLQSDSDIFIVLSWNTAQAQGVMTGKFFEGIRCRKPMLALVAGSVPNSELYRLQQKYHYGFCYEEASNEQDQERLADWLLQAYRCCREGLPVPYEPEEALFSAFRYDTLTKQLESLCQTLLEEQK